jgi:hypothetical protein
MKASMPSLGSARAAAIVSGRITRTPSSAPPPSSIW